MRDLLQNMGARSAITLFFLSLLVAILGAIVVLRTPVFYTHPPTDVAAETQRWQKRIQAVGMAQAYSEFGRAITRLTPANRHFMAHIFGAALYEAEGIKGLSTCDTRFLYGCFHELLSRALLEYGLQAIEEIEAACLSSPNADAPLSCKHGIGHGLVAYFGYDTLNLKNALVVCDRLGEDPIGACYEGVFMEYLLRFFSAADGADARTFIREDPYDVCVDFEGIKAKRCIGLLALWWRTSVFSNEITTADYRWMGGLCDTLPAHVAEYRYTCFRGIGFAAVVDAAALSDITEACYAASSNIADVRDCILYATITVANNQGASAGTALCEVLQADMVEQCREYASTEKLI